MPFSAIVYLLNTQFFSEVKDNYCLVLRELCGKLASSGQIADLFSTYQQACDVYPDCETMLNDMGAQLFR